MNQYSSGVVATRSEITAYLSEVVAVLCNRLISWTEIPADTIEKETSIHIL